MSSAKLTTIGFDADDTLWHNMKFYDLTEARFAALLSDYAEKAQLSERLLAAEEKLLHSPVASVVEKDALRRFTVAAGTSGFLIIRLK